MGLKGDISGMVSMMDMMRKYTLARRLNWISRALIMKSYQVYLDVLTKFD